MGRYSHEGDSENGIDAPQPLRVVRGSCHGTHLIQGVPSDRPSSLSKIAVIPIGATPLGPYGCGSDSGWQERASRGRDNQFLRSDQPPQGKVLSVRWYARLFGHLFNAPYSCQNLSPQLVSCSFSIAREVGTLTKIHHQSNTRSQSSNPAAKDATQDLARLLSNVGKRSLTGSRRMSHRRTSRPKPSMMETPSCMPNISWG